MLNTISGAALISGAAEIKKAIKYKGEKMAKIEKAKVGKFIVINKKGFDKKEAVLGEAQCWVGGEQVYAGDVLQMEVNSQDAKELISRSIVIPVDDEAKKVYKNFENDKLVKEMDEVAKAREAYLKNKGK